MKLRFNNGAIQTCQGNIGVLFIAAGLAQEVFEAPQPVVKTPSEWAASVDAHTGRPYIQARCTNNCKQIQRYVGPNADKQVFWHCGFVGGEKVPAEIAQAFSKLRPAKPPKSLEAVLREQEQADYDALKARGDAL